MYIMRHYVTSLTDFYTRLYINSHQQHTAAHTRSCVNDIDLDIDLYSVTHEFVFTGTCGAYDAELKNNRIILHSAINLIFSLLKNHQKYLAFKSKPSN